MMLIALAAASLDQEPIARATALRMGCLAVALIGGMVTGLLVTSRRMARPTANRKAHLSLIVLLSSWLVYGAATALLKSRDPGSPLAFLGLVAFGGCVLVSIILSVLGLSEFGRERGRYREGKGPAITTLVLSGLIAVALVGAFGFGVMRGLVQARSRQAPAVFEDLRFSVHPPQPWSKFDPAKSGSPAAVAYRRDRPEAYFMIIAEPLDSESPPDLESFVQAVKTNLGGAAKDMIVVEEAVEVVAGASGIRLVCEATMAGLPLTYRYWIYRSPHAVYQLIIWVHRRDSAALGAEARKVFDSFTLLQPK